MNSPNKRKSGPKAKGKLRDGPLPKAATPLPAAAGKSIDRFRTRSMDHSLQDVLPSLISNAIKSLEPELSSAGTDPSMAFARYRNIIKDPATIRLLVTSTCQAGCQPTDRIDPNAIFIAADKRHTISLSFAARGLTRVLDEHDTVKSTAALKDKYINVSLANLEMAINLDNFPREVRLHLVVLQFSLDSFERPDEPINNMGDVERHHGVLAQLNLRRSKFKRPRPQVSSRPPADRLFDLLDLCGPPPSSSSETSDLGSPRNYFLTDTQEQALAHVPWPPANTSQIGSQGSHAQSQAGGSQHSLPPSPPPETLDHPPPPPHVDFGDTPDADTSAGDMSKMALPPPSGVTASQLPSSPDDHRFAAPRQPAAVQRLVPTFSDFDSPSILSQGVLTRFIGTTAANALPPPTLGPSGGADESLSSSSASTMSPPISSRDPTRRRVVHSPPPLNPHLEVAEPEPTLLSRLPPSTLFRSTASTGSPAAARPDDQFTPPSPGASSDAEPAAAPPAYHGAFAPPMSTQQLMHEHAIGSIAHATQAFAGWTQVMAHEGEAGEARVSFDGLLEVESMWPVERQREAVEVSEDEGGTEEVVPSGSSDVIAPDSLMYFTPDHDEDIEAEDEPTRQQLSFEGTVDNLLDERSATQFSSTIAPPTPAAREVIDVPDSPEPSPVLRTSLSSPPQSQPDPLATASATAANQTLSTVISATQSQFSPHQHQAPGARVPLAPNEAVSVHFPLPVREAPVVVSDESTISGGSETQLDVPISLLHAPGSGSGSGSGPEMSTLTVSPTQSFMKLSQDWRVGGKVVGRGLEAVTEEEHVEPPPPSFAEEPGVLIGSSISPIAHVPPPPPPPPPAIAPAARDTASAYPGMPPLPIPLHHPRSRPAQRAVPAVEAPHPPSSDKPKLTRRPPRPSTAKPTTTPAPAAASPSLSSKHVFRLAPSSGLTSPPTNPPTNRARPSAQPATSSEASSTITSAPSSSGTSHVAQLLASKRFTTPKVDLTSRLLRVAPVLPPLPLPAAHSATLGSSLGSRVSANGAEVSETVPPSTRPAASNAGAPNRRLDRAAVHSDGAQAQPSMGRAGARRDVADDAAETRAVAAAPTDRVQRSTVVHAEPDDGILVDVQPERVSTGTGGRPARAQPGPKPGTVAEPPASAAQAPTPLPPPLHHQPLVSSSPQPPPPRPNSRKTNVPTVPILPPSPAPPAPPPAHEPTRSAPPASSRAAHFQSPPHPSPPPDLPPASNTSARSHSSSTGPQLIIRGIKRKHDATKPKPPIDVDPFEEQRAAMAAMLASSRNSRASGARGEPKAVGRKSKKSRADGEEDDEGRPPSKKQRKA